MSFLSLGQMIHTSGAYPTFHLHETTSHISTTPCMGCYSITGLFPSVKFLATHLHTWKDRRTVRQMSYVHEYITITLAKA